MDSGAWQVLKDKGLPFGIGGLVGAVLMAIIPMNIFATQGQLQEVRVEIQKQRTEMAEIYVRRDEFEKRMDRFESTINRIADRLNAK